MGEIIDCVQKKCQLEPDTDIEDIDDEDKIEPVTNALLKEDAKELDNHEQNNNPKEVNDHYIQNSVQESPCLGKQLSMRDYELKD